MTPEFVATKQEKGTPLGLQVCDLAPAMSRRAGRGPGEAAASRRWSAASATGAKLGAARAQFSTARP